MRGLTLFAALVGLAGQGLAWKSEDVSTTYTTVVVTAFTTYCPSSTTWAFKNTTYTVTSPTTITVTNCPCTVIHTQPPPVTTTTTYCPPGNSTSINSTSIVISTPPPTSSLSGVTTSTPHPVGPSSVPPYVTVAAAPSLAAGVGLMAGLAGAVALVL